MTKEANQPDRPMSTLDQLQALAEAATPHTEGRWRYRRCDFGRGPDRDYSYVEWGASDSGYGTGALDPTMARYIAAVDPSTVLALIAVARAALAAVDQFLDGDQKGLMGALADLAADVQPFVQPFADEVSE